MSAFLVLIPSSDDVSASQYDIVGGKRLFHTGETLAADDEDGIYIVSFPSGTSSPYYVVRMTMLNMDGSTASSGSVTSSYYYSSSDGAKKGLAVTAPSTAGKYMIKAEFQLTSSSSSEKVTMYYSITVVEPIKLSAVITNTGNHDITLTTVSFIIDGVKMDPINDGNSITVAANSTYTATYDWIVANPSDGQHTFKLDVQPSDVIKVDLKGLDTTYSFYVGQNDHSLMMWIFVIILVVLAIVLIWILRKPVKNLGKPKGRRR